MTIRYPSAAALLLAAAALTACAPDAEPPAAPGSSAPGSSAPGGATTAPTVPPPPAAASIPTDCRGLVDAATYTATFGETPLNDPLSIEPGRAGAVTPTAAPVGATYREIIDSATELRCLWRAPDAALRYLQVDVGTVPPNVGRARLDQLAADGYRCEDALDGRRCQRVSEVEGSEASTIDRAVTQFLRDDVYIQVEQLDFPTDGLLPSIVDELWG